MLWAHGSQGRWIASALAPNITSVLFWRWCLVTPAVAGCSLSTLCSGILQDDVALMSDILRCSKKGIYILIFVTTLPNFIPIEVPCYSRAAMGKDPVLFKSFWADTCYGLGSLDLPGILFSKSHKLWSEVIGSLRHTCAETQHVQN